ncbi:hypothetical protein [Bradyrhizobium vignae]|uniref:Uncharacterized protein n=1 Tax=Bradyrhizobium vignae TaxID=1549949 RepID=A0ABS3ZQQ1_9BRAD|nr:hypothetical protein [Bradyrhizobium vignae]MBP0110463.1 hypothetical protein [Bradyrhizobium vignae]
MQLFFRDPARSIELNGSEIMSGREMLAVLTLCTQALAHAILRLGLFGLFERASTWFEFQGRGSQQ